MNNKQNQKHYQFLALCPILPAELSLTFVTLILETSGIKILHKCVKIPDLTVIKVNADLVLHTWFEAVCNNQR